MSAKEPVVSVFPVTYIVAGSVTKDRAKLGYGAPLGPITLPSISVVTFIFWREIYAGLNKIVVFEQIKFGDIYVGVYLMSII